jgi:hypothetical protein
VTYLKFLIAKQEASYVSLQRETGIGRQAIKAIAVGRLIPTPEELAKLARAFGVTEPAALLNEVVLDDAGVRA